MPYFQIGQDVGAEWRWRFRADNHEIIASGEGYKRRADCEYAIAMLKTHAAAAPIKADLPTSGLLSMTRNALDTQKGTVLGNAMNNAMTRGRP